jgi:hypothetical protein
VDDCNIATDSYEVVPLLMYNCAYEYYAAVTWVAWSHKYALKQDQRNESRKDKANVGGKEMQKRKSWRKEKDKADDIRNSNRKNKSEREKRQ